MQYGHFDNKSREYVIDRVDLPVSWTNYIGVGDMYGVFNHTAGGYLLYKTPEYHRITRFHPNGVPMDGPGHYIYIRDDETGDYWSVSWQPVGRDIEILVPPRAELREISLRLQRYPRRTDPFRRNGRPCRALESDAVQPQRQAAQALGILLLRVQLPPDRHGQPQLPDEPLRRGQQLCRRHNRARAAL